MRQIKIPRSSKKAIKEEAKIESGFYGSQIIDKDKQKTKQGRSARFKSTNIGRKIGKIFNKGKYNLDRGDEGGGLGVKPPNPPSPPRPKLQDAGFRHRRFTSQGEDVSQRFDVSDTTEQGLIKKVRVEEARVGAKIGDDKKITQGLEPIFKSNESKTLNYSKAKASQYKYKAGERTDEMEAKREISKKSNKGLSRRDAYRFAKKTKLDEYRNKANK